jgi:hypothetical protein
MAELVANCVRCGTDRITFDVNSVHLISVQYGWQHWFEAFSICRNCSTSTIFILRETPQSHDIKLFQHESPLNVEGSLNNYFVVDGFVSLKHEATVSPPEYVPENVANVFREGATCLAVGCWNAAGTMFRMCVDLATKPLLPAEETQGLNNKTRRDLGLRLPWLFDNGILPADLGDLSSCIREDGNDAAHQGTLTSDDAEDLLDFTNALLERLFTEPKRLEIAKERRERRRTPKE